MGILNRVLSVKPQSYTETSINGLTVAEDACIVCARLIPPIRKSTANELTRRNKIFTEFCDSCLDDLRAGVLCPNMAPL